MSDHIQPPADETAAAARLALAADLPTGPIGALQIPTRPSAHDHNNLRHLLLQEVEAAGVDLGPLDRQVLSFIAHCGHETAVVVASLLRRLYFAGENAIRDDDDTDGGDR